MNAYFKGNLIFNSRGPAGPDGNPTGTVINFMGTTAPADYLVCNGAEYSISDHYDLASFFTDQFGEANHFGGDGVTTFAVPNIQSPANMAVLYCIKAVDSMTGGTSEEIYSTEETRIGTWVDGKPLYRKSYQFQQLVETTYNNYPIDSGYAEKNIVHWNGTMRPPLDWGYGKQEYCLPRSESPYLANISTIDDNLVVNAQWNIEVNFTFVLTIEYTKTTD